MQEIYSADSAEWPLSEDQVYTPKKSVTNRLLAANCNWSDEDRELINYFRPQLDDLKTMKSVNCFYAYTKFGNPLRSFLLEYVVFGPKKFTFGCGTRDGITDCSRYYTHLNDLCLLFGTPTEPLETPMQRFYNYKFIIQAPKTRFSVKGCRYTDPVAVCNGVRNLKASYDTVESKAEKTPLLQNNDALEAVLIDIVTNGKQVVPKRYW